MDTVLKLIRRADCAAEKTTELNREKLIAEIKNISLLLAYNDCWFQRESDEDLIEACIYQRGELEARYRYLLGLAKQQGINRTAF